MHSLFQWRRQANTCSGSQPPWRMHQPLSKLLCRSESLLERTTVRSVFRFMTKSRELFTSMLLLEIATMSIVSGSPGWPVCCCVCALPQVKTTQVRGLLECAAVVRCAAYSLRCVLQALPARISHIACVNYFTLQWSKCSSALFTSNT